MAALDVLSPKTRTWFERAFAGPTPAQELVPEYPCLGKINSAEDLAEYQAAKRAYKSARREQERAATT